MANLMLNIVAYQQTRFSQDARNHCFSVAFVTKNKKVAKATLQNVYGASDMIRLSECKEVENIDNFIEEYNAPIEKELEMKRKEEIEKDTLRD